MIAVFAAYTVSIGWAISKGSLIASEDSDDSSDDGSSIDSARTSIGQEGPGNQETDALLYERGGSAPVL